MPCRKILDDRLDPPIGLLYVGTYLEKNGFNVHISDLSGIAEEDWLSKVPKSNVYGFVTYTASYHEVMKLKESLEKSDKSLVTVAGGPHASALPHDLIQHFDFVVVGEGELIMKELLCRLDVERGLKGEILLGRPVVNLDDLPIIDYQLVDIYSYTRRILGKRAAALITSRGCNFDCYFCAGNIDGLRTHVRFRTPGNVMKEISLLRTEFGFEAFKFHDDSFGSDHKRLRKLCSYLSGLKILYECNMNVVDCTSENVGILKKSGCVAVSLGVESCNDEQLKNMNKPQTKLQTVSAIKRLKGDGIQVKANLIVGFPGETWKSVEETTDTLIRLKPDSAFVAAFIPSPGTLPFREPQMFGINRICNDYSKFYHLDKSGNTSYVFSTNDLSPEKVREMREYVVRTLGENDIRVGA